MGICASYTETTKACLPIAFAGSALARAAVSGDTIEHMTTRV